MPNLWKRLFGGKNEALESPRTSNEPTTPDVAKTPDNLPPLANIAEEMDGSVSAMDLDSVVDGLNQLSQQESQKMHEK